ncbi:fumarylacetoacetate hydrolase family protein [Streptomyces dubilierae]|uniref:Fumarylacetoacetate hydrolase family protein n=1 Tax=Streptomyces dubilierae TaxID=3075533 RepID=A0ABU2P1M7_9ACTN|nr:fumarylacetoacetate hydrolase family protein [Streptomyces sp. DSM 41921]MDT0386034.1 fumarylacetoacetate hydrolase family protein [Streptomyces sp. DSM 41921]
MWPGDVTLTGTPAGVGWGRQPPRYLSPGDTLTTHVEHIGTLTQRFT